MLEKWRETLQGKKTYVVGIGSIIGLLVAWTQGTVTTPDFIQGVITAVLGMTIRAGVTSETNK